MLLSKFSEIIWYFHVPFYGMPGIWTINILIFKIIIKKFDNKRSTRDQTSPKLKSYQHGLSHDPTYLLSIFSHSEFWCNSCRVYRTYCSVTIIAGSSYSIATAAGFWLFIQWLLRHCSGYLFNGSTTADSDCLFNSYYCRVLAVYSIAFTVGFWLFIQYLLLQGCLFNSNHCRILAV